MPQTRETRVANELAGALGALELGGPRSWRGLTVFPLLAQRGEAPAYDSFGEAHAAGTFHITEVSESGVVAQLRAVNEGTRPVLLLDGEAVIGAKQNRVLNITVIVPAHTTLDIPVSCVEQGRWHAQTKTFGAADHALFAYGRARKARDVTRSLRTSGRADADQGAVWRDVAEGLSKLGVHSSTGAMSAAYEKNHASLAEYVAAFPPEPAQVGGVYALAGDVVGLDLFDSPAAFRAAAPKLTQSYALELLHTSPAEVQPDRTTAAQLIDDVAHVHVTTHKATGDGSDIRFDDGTVTGGALTLGDRVIHLFAFRPRVLSDDPRGPARRAARHSDDGGRARTLIHDGIMHCQAGTIFDRQPAPLAVSGVVLRDRIYGMLLGLAIGDALGNTSESMTPAQRRARYGEIRDYVSNPHASGRRVGLPSDDTQLAFRTLRRLLDDGALVPENIARDFAGERIIGIGATVRGFIRSFKDERRPWFEAAQPSAGNGALMRIAPVLLPHLRTPSPRLWSDAAVAAMITHNDPASIGACVAFTDLLWRLLASRAAPEAGTWLRTFVHTLRDVEGDAARYAPRVPHLGGPTSLWAFTHRHVRDALTHRRDTLAACETWHSGAYLLETVPSVLYILERHGHDPEEAIVRAVNDTYDNDTVAAIVGAAVGALHGPSRLPERWVRGLLGRTGEHDDGEVFRLIARAQHTFAGIPVQEPPIR